MTDRQKFREDIHKIAKDSKEVEKDVVAFAKKEYAVMLEQAREKGTNISTATRHMLDDVEIGLKEAGHDSADILTKTAEGLVTITRDITGQSLEAVRSYADSAKSLMNRALEKSEGKIDKIDEGTKTKMEEAHSKLHEQTLHVLGQMETVGKAIIDYSAEKASELGETAGPKLKQTAEKGREYAVEAEQQAAAYSKKLLHHSQDSAAKWLRKLADLVTPGKE
jgi:Na+/phosphate symporter